MMNRARFTAATVGRSDSECHAQAEFAAAATLPRRLAFNEILAAAIGERYPTTAVPVAIDRARFQRMTETVEAAVRLMVSPAYQAEVARTPWLLPSRPIGLDDCCGSVDFHIFGDEEKITEVNPMPPGFLGLLELLDNARSEVFGDAHPRLNEGYERALADFMSDRGRFSSLAIAINHTAASRKFVPHYRYLAKAMCRAGLDAQLALARSVTADAAGEVFAGDRRVARVFSIVIYRIMEREPERFASLIDLYHRHPEAIAPNPFVWRLGSKAILPKLFAIEAQPYGLDGADQQALKRAALPAAMLSDFADPDALAAAFGGFDNVVLKPTDDYSSTGVFIKPAREVVARLIAEQPRPYVVQRYFGSSTTPAFDDTGALVPRRITVRVGYLRGKVFGVRVATDPLQSDRLASAIAPVVVV